MGGSDFYRSAEKRLRDKAKASATVNVSSSYTSSNGKLVAAPAVAK